MSTDPMQLPCALNWSSWDWSCAHSRPCEFCILPVSRTPPCLWTWWWNCLDSLPQTPHEVGRDRPDFFGQGRGEIRGGGSVDFFYRGWTMRKTNTKISLNLVHPISLDGNQDFAAAVQTSLSPRRAFPAPCHCAPTPLTEPFTSRCLTSTYLLFPGVNSRSCLFVWSWSYLQSGTGWPV